MTCPTRVQVVAITDGDRQSCYACCMHRLLCYICSATRPCATRAHGHLLSHARLCAETIALIRRRTKEVMNQPEMIAWLKATHKPQLHDMDVRVRFFWLTCSDWLRCSTAFLGWHQERNSKNGVRCTDSCSKKKLQGVVGVGAGPGLTGLTSRWCMHDEFMLDGGSTVLRELAHAQILGRPSNLQRMPLYASHVDLCCRLPGKH